MSEQDIADFQKRYVQPLLRGLVQVEAKAGYPPTNIVPRKRRHIQRKRCKWCGKFYAQYERESDERFLKRKWCSNEHRQLWAREKEMRRIEKRYGITLPREGELAGGPFST